MTTAAAQTPGPSLDADGYFRALAARDRRFDGQFFVTVRSTGIYCRPSCPAIRPRRENVDFVLTAAAAQQRGFRACKRCLPDAVPGSPLWDVGSDIASRAMRLIGDGVVDRGGVDGLARTLGYSPRHLTRILTDHLGAGPLALARANRATTARVLIQCTAMSMSDIAFAAGFASIRQFNDTVREVFDETPTGLRRRGAVTGGAVSPGAAAVRLRLGVRAPFAAPWLDWFMAGHVVAGLEHHDGTTFHRAIATPRGHSVLSVTLHEDHIDATVRTDDLRDLGSTIHRVRRLFDADADAQGVDDALRADPQIGPLVDEWSGIRVPGALDPFETLVRTMVGQQISLAAARTHVGRLVTTLGEPVDAPSDTGVTHLFPTPAAIAEHGPDVLRGPRRRVAAICDVARAVDEGEVTLHPGMTSDDLRTSLLARPGIGRWTADYVVMRVLRDPDILLDGDLVLARHASALGIDLSDSGRWSPWRSYVSMHLWRHALAPSVPQLRSADGTVRGPAASDAVQARPRQELT
ncbi:Ada metal-binding domain-containing protein [Williamsia deligens]|uniref:DNA-3-methyladenine glycosylase II n=1 Tax=Williamsia deligens TaxID=321325 RepID=A0ABW3G439_9NOCA|nr:Ada metal-binding domain-containing protein [Williamsia deligens]MCP2194916.1 DNA-3-methyladenine glycosylase II [Williamsia deligens]